MAATFAYDMDIKQGKIEAEVHKSLNPYGVKVRESRDSAGNDCVPIAVFLDTTGSMAQVPGIMQQKLPRLMDAFVADKKSGKKYLGKKGYPAIMIGAVDDCAAMRSRGSQSGSGALQVGQFESGIEIDEDITNLWLTGNGGGTYDESYEMALYFMARHTQHDHWDKRTKKGYIFIIGDEHSYREVSPRYVREVIGDELAEPITIEDLVKEVEEKYHIFFVLPKMTSHYGDRELEKYWKKLLGEDNFIRLEDPDKICEAIVAAVAITEENISAEDIKDDLGISGILRPIKV
jgi:hypothetical protein